MPNDKGQFRIDVLRCSGCNKQFRAIATENRHVTCSHCSTRYKFQNGEWKWAKPKPRVPTDKKIDECVDCEETENLHTCVGCEKTFCVDCLTWGHAENDPPNGDWFCDGCSD